MFFIIMILDEASFFVIMIIVDFDWMYKAKSKKEERIL